MNEYESAAMWKLYLKSNEGIAIQSTYKDLRSCLPDDAEISTVRYIDYKKSFLPDTNLYIPFVYKRKSFEHEQELRAIILNIDSEVWKKGSWPDAQAVSKNIKIDLNALVNRVYLAPYSEKWFEDIVRDVTKQYGFSNIKIHRSPLEEKPFF